MRCGTPSLEPVNAKACRCLGYLTAAMCVNQAGALTLRNSRQRRATLTVAHADVAPPSAAPDAIAEAANYAKHLLAGAMSAMVSRTCCAPMERVKMQMMLHERTGTVLMVAGGIYRAEGVPGFWRGNGLNILRTAPFKAVNFFSFDMFRKTFTRLGGGTLSNEARLTAGALAGRRGLGDCSIKLPGADVRSHPLRTLVRIAKTEGVAALYVGIGPSLLGMVPSGAIYYWMYDLLKERQFKLVAKRKGRRPDRLDTGHSLLFGALAGCTAESLVFPLEVVRRRMQTLAAEGLGQRGVMGVRHAVLDIWAQERLRGFYAGMLPNTVQVLPSAALSYAAFEASKSLLRVKE